MPLIRKDFTFFTSSFFFLHFCPVYKVRSLYFREGNYECLRVWYLNGKSALVFLKTPPLAEQRILIAKYIRKKEVNYVLVKVI